MTDLATGDFFRAIYGDQTGHLCIFSGEREKKPSHQKPKLLDVSPRFFLYPAHLDDAVAEATAQTEAGREAYCGAHLLTAPKRTKEHAAPLMSLYCDLDHTTLSGDVPHPTVIVESSPGKWQCWWSLTEPIEPVAGEALNKRLTYAVAADGSGWDLSQVLRIPNALNHKYDHDGAGQSPHRVRIESADLSRRYTAADFDGLPNPPTPAPATPAVGTWEDAPDRDDVLARYEQDITPELWAILTRPQLDRSGRLWRAAKICFQIGMSEEKAVALLEQSANDKYSEERRSGYLADTVVKGYQEFAAEAEAWKTFGPDDLTENWNVRRFVEDHGHRIRYCAQMGGWLIFDGQRWIKDETGEIWRLAEVTVSGMYRLAADLGFGMRDLLVKHAKKAGSRKGLEAMVWGADHQPGIATVAEDFDRNPYLLCVENGVINFATGELYPHDPADLITKMAPVEWKPGHPRPHWDKTISRALSGDPDAIEYFQVLLSLAPVGVARERIIPIIHGGKATGKSKIVGAISEILGPDYVVNLGEATVTMPRWTKDGGSPSSDIVKLRGARLAVISETSPNLPIHSARLKAWSGGNKITARAPYGKKDYEFAPQFLVLFETNDLPNVPASDDPFWSRCRVIHFDNPIPLDDQLPDFEDVLREEYPGILDWLVTGYQTYLAWGKLGHPPAAVEQATNDYRLTQDTVMAFLDLHLVRDTAAITETDTLFDAYRSWCDARDLSPLSSKRKFSQRLTEIGEPVVHTVGTRRSARKGLRLPDVNDVAGSVTSIEPEPMRLAA